MPPPFPAVGQDPWNRLLGGLKPLPRVVAAEGTACGLWDASDRPRVHLAGVGSFLLYSVHEGIRGIPLDPNDKSDALVPVSGTSLAVGIDFHAGDAGLERSGRGMSPACPLATSPLGVKVPSPHCCGCSSAQLCAVCGVTVTDTPSPAWPLSENDTIYWVDMGLSTISRAKRDQTWREDVVTNGIGRVEGIAVDWIAGEPGLRGQGVDGERGSRGVFTGPSLQETSTGRTRASMSSRWPG